MLKKILIDAMYPERSKFIKTDKNNEIEKIYCKDQHKNKISGNVYIGIIKRIVPSLEATFVDYGNNKNGFLPFKLIHPKYYIKRNKRKKIIKKNQIILIQIIKEEKNNKGALITTYISIKGKYCILYPITKKKNIGISNKIKNIKEKIRLINISKKIINIYNNASVIFNKNIIYKKKKYIYKDIKKTIEIWERIKLAAINVKNPHLLYEEDDIIIDNIKKYYNNHIEKIIISGTSTYIKVYNFFKIFIPNEIYKIQEYKMYIPIINYYKINNQIENLCYNFVKLKSRGYIIINISDAMTCIDVNSGANRKNKNMKATALNNNIEAATEIAKQIQLRNISGLISIDFIDKISKKKKRFIEKTIREELIKDDAKITMGQINKFGILEISRQRIGMSIMENISQKCPQCIGYGRVISNNEISYLLINKLSYIIYNNYYKKNKKKEYIIILARSEIVIKIINNFKKEIVFLEKKFKIKICISIDNTMLYEQYKILISDQREILLNIKY